MLDRDGVLNRMVVDPEQGTIDSPLHPREVELVDGAAQAVNRLTKAGYTLAIVSNQPAAAKGKTTRKNLEDVNTEIIRMLTANGGNIASSHICFHRREDNCTCRKPRPGLLEAALLQNPTANKTAIWMVGDGVTDIEAGNTLGLQTAFLAEHKCDVCQETKRRNATPTVWKRDLLDFSEFLVKT